MPVFNSDVASIFNELADLLEYTREPVHIPDGWKLKTLGINTPGIQIIMGMRRRIEKLQNEVSELKKMFLEREQYKR
jgi:hypothetical protein